MPKQPNMVLILTDQQRGDTVGTGAVADFCRTPNLDRLASESVLLSNHYTNSSLCVPARNSLITSTWPQENGAIVNGWSPEERPFSMMREGLDTMYDSLVRAGYEVIHLGVDHLRATPPMCQRPGIRCAWSRGEYQKLMLEKGFALHGPKHVSPGVDFIHGRAINRGYTNPIPAVWDHPTEEFFEFWLANGVVKEIESLGGDKPFALFINFWSPHCPLMCPEPYFSMYSPEDVPMTEDVGKWFPHQSPLNLLNTCGTVAANITPEMWRQARAVYFGMVTMADEAIGRVLDALKQNGLWDDTLVWASADHGDMVGSHNLFQKMCLYEPAVRVPSIVKPRASAGITPRTLGALTQHLDIAPTILDYAGAEPLATASHGPEAGRNLRDLIEGKEEPGVRNIIINHNGNSGRAFHQRAICDGRWKLIHNHGILADDPPGRFAAELYDLENDPHEVHNRLADPTDQERALARKLLDNLRDWMRRVNDLIPPPGDDVLCWP